MTEITPVGLDVGNTWVKICIDGLVAKIPSRYAFQKPPGAISAKTGIELKPVAFKLIFEDRTLWFGIDTLGAGAIQKLGMGKYNPGHINVLFQAVLFQWAKTHKRSLADLGKLNIVCSMPPGLYQKAHSNKIALGAFRKAFNRGKGHVKIRDGREAIQIVTQLGKLVPEAVVWGQARPRQDEMVMTADLGGGTVDYVVFNGGSEPLITLTDNAGLLHAFAAMGKGGDPSLAELKVLRNKKELPDQLKTHYSVIEGRIQLATAHLGQIDRLYIIGGGAALMPPKIRAGFELLATKVFFKNEFANAEANWRHAGGVL